MDLSERDSLSAFVDPSSIAVVGASGNVAKWGHWLARGALASARADRAVYLVNRRGEPVLGYPTYRSLSDLEQPAELVVVAVPPGAVDAVVDDALELGARGFLMVVAGIDKEDEARLAARVRAGGARLLGPNCLGLYDAAHGVHLVPWASFSKGPLAVVSQSGQLGLEIAELAGRAGMGVSSFFSVGNQADVTAEEVLSELVSDEESGIVALYLESFGDGRAITHALAELRRAGKSVVAMTAGSSAAGRSAARSHTGSLTSPHDVVEAACRAAGAVLVRTARELVDAAQLLVRSPRLRGGRVAVLGDSGGQGAIAADLAVAAGLEVEPLPGDVVSSLARRLPRHAGLSNPIDLAGAGEGDISTYAELVSTLAGSPAVDAVILTGYFGRYGEDAPELAGAEVDVARRIGATSLSSGKPVVVHSLARRSPALQALAESGVPSYETIESAVGALATGRRHAQALVRANELLARSRLPGRPGASPATEAPLPGLGVVSQPSYLLAREVAERFGVSFPPAAVVEDEEGLGLAVKALRAPYVLKADRLEHKTEQRGVVVGLANDAEVIETYHDLVGRLGSGRYVLEEQDLRAGVVEMIVSAFRDPAFGPVVTVGMGGVSAELISDVSLELAPVDDDLALEMLSRLRSYRLLTGWRGSAAVDLEALAGVVSSVSQVLGSIEEIDEIELNPVRVGSRGAFAVDALLCFSESYRGRGTASISSR